MIDKPCSNKIFARPYAGEDDWWAVRRLLIETYPVTPPYWNWEMRRWDGWRFHSADPELPQDKCAQIHLWETDEGQLVGVVHPEGPGHGFIELDPDYRHLEEEMVCWAEEHLSIYDQEVEDTRFDFFVWEYDVCRQSLLLRRGYQKTEWSGIVRHLRLGCQSLPPMSLAYGYSLRTTRPSEYADCERMAALLNAAFNRTFHTAGDYVTFTDMSPSFRHDLNLIAEMPDGSFAAHVGLNYDPVNRRAIFEPVCTHPAHRQKGLAQALMFEGLHRLAALGAKDVFVETGSAVPANALYESIGFGEKYLGHVWRKSGGR
jgi:mycothiol synthase